MSLGLLEGRKQANKKTIWEEIWVMNNPMCPGHSSLSHLHVSSFHMGETLAELQISNVFARVKAMMAHCPLVFKTMN